MVVLASPSGRRTLFLVSLLLAAPVAAVGCRPGGDPARPTSAATMALERPDLAAATAGSSVAPASAATGLPAAHPARPSRETPRWSAAIVAR